MYSIKDELLYINYKRGMSSFFFETPESMVLYPHH